MDGPQADPDAPRGPARRRRGPGLSEVPGPKKQTPEGGGLETALLPPGDEEALAHLQRLERRQSQAAAASATLPLLGLALALPRILFLQGAPSWTGPLAFLGALFLVAAGVAFGAVMRLAQQLDEVRQVLPEEPEESPSEGVR